MRSPSDLPSRPLRSRRTALAVAAALVLAGAPSRVHAAPEAAVEEPDWPAGTTAAPAEDGVRKVWDVLFWRPFYVVQLVGGVAALPVALPLAAAVGSWEDSIDICVTGPAEMAFERPLGE